MSGLGFLIDKLSAVQDLHNGFPFGRAQGAWGCGPRPRIERRPFAPKFLPIQTRWRQIQGLTTGTDPWDCENRKASSISSRLRSLRCSPERFPTVARLFFGDPAWLQTSRACVSASDSQPPLASVDDPEEPALPCVPACEGSRPAAFPARVGGARSADLTSKALLGAVMLPLHPTHSHRSAQGPERAENRRRVALAGTSGFRERRPCRAPSVRQRFWRPLRSFRVSKILSFLSLLFPIILPASALYSNLAGKKCLTIIGTEGRLYETLKAQRQLRDQKFPACQQVFFKSQDWQTRNELQRLGDGLQEDWSSWSTLSHLRRTGVRNHVRAGVPERVASPFQGTRQGLSLTDTRKLRAAASAVDSYLDSTTASGSGERDRLKQGSFRLRVFEVLEKAYVNDQGKVTHRDHVNMT